MPWSLPLMRVLHAQPHLCTERVRRWCADKDSYHLDLPTACPVIYDFDDTMQLAQVHGFWGESDVPRHGRFLIDTKLVSQTHAQPQTAPDHPRPPQTVPDRPRPPQPAPDSRYQAVAQE